MVILNLIYTYLIRYTIVFLRRCFSFTIDCGSSPLHSFWFINALMIFSDDISKPHHSTHTRYCIEAPFTACFVSLYFIRLFPIIIFCLTSTLLLNLPICSCSAMTCITHRFPLNIAVSWTAVSRSALNYDVLIGLRNRLLARCSSKYSGNLIGGYCSDAMIILFEFLDSSVGLYSCINQ